MRNISGSSFVDSRSHYMLLDGLRGVAALLVVWYHVFEGFAFAGGGTIETLNHGYLAVDFFFILSGFVIGYAYDERWKGSLTIGNFFVRRLVRLQPMAVLGTILGGITFCIGGSMQWDGTHIHLSLVLLAVLCGMLFIPAVPGKSSYDVRGNGEMFSLNGPAWSLFFEYIGNVLYALILRKFSTKVLIVFVMLLSVVYIWFATFNISAYGSIGVGWTLDSVNFFGGLLRMLFPFALGLLLSRKFKPIKIKGAFPICVVVLIAVFSVPYLNEVSGVHINGVYEACCVMLLFPILVWIGASGTTTDSKSTMICRFLGDISYPIYMIHYPIMYLFYSWLIENKLYTLGDTWQVAVIIFVGCIILAYLCLKLYDEPVRRFISRKWQSSQ